MRVLISIWILCLIGCKPPTTDNYFISFDETKIAYTDQGNGPVVLLIHGFINTRKSWEGTNIKEQLLTKGYRVIAPDLRGNGDSGKPQDHTSYANNAEVKDLIGLISHLKIKQYEAVGYSRGAIILAKLLTKDKRISKAVIGGMGANFTRSDWEIPKLFSKAFSGKDTLTDMTRGAVTYAKSIKADLPSLSFQQQHQPVTTKTELSEITIPVLLVRGDKDTSNGDPKELQQAIPNSVLTFVPGDHNTTYRKEPFGKVVLDFLTLK